MSIKHHLNALLSNTLPQTVTVTCHLLCYSLPRSRRRCFATKSCGVQLKAHLWRIVCDVLPICEMQGKEKEILSKTCQKTLVASIKSACSGKGARVGSGTTVGNESPNLKASWRDVEGVLMGRRGLWLMYEQGIGLGNVVCAVKGEERRCQGSGDLICRAVTQFPKSRRSNDHHSPFTIQ